MVAIERKIREKRIKFGRVQTKKLEEWISTHEEFTYPKAEDLEELISKTGLSDKQIRVWFTNHRNVSLTLLNLHAAKTISCRDLPVENKIQLAEQELPGMFTQLINVTEKIQKAEGQARKRDQSILFVKVLLPLRHQHGAVFR